MDFAAFNPLFRLALEEDLGNGDHSSLSCIPQNARSTARMLIKEDGIVAGLELARHVFHLYDPNLEIRLNNRDGDRVKKGDVVLTASGSSRSLLTTERTVLNFVQRLSGIATQTGRYVEKLTGTRTRVLDTRKTTPGWRQLEKWAVIQGGGSNHRMGLYDMIMLKDNHIDVNGGISGAVKRVREYLSELGKQLPIEVEVRNAEELEEVLNIIPPVDRVMLDNFDLPSTKKAVERIGGRIETESSGGITLETIRQYAECGVDYVSVGALTHSVKSLDISLKIGEWVN